MAAASTTWHRASRRVAVAVGVGAVLPLSWTPATVGEHAQAATLIASAALLSLLAVHRLPTEEERYAEALHDAVAVEVRLGHVRVATVHDRSGRRTAVVTWRESRSELLDRHGRPLAALRRNALATGWTMSVVLDEPEIAWLLGPDGGRLVLRAGVDTTHDPWARVGNSPLRIERCEVALSA